MRQWVAAACVAIVVAWSARAAAEAPSIGKAKIVKGQVTVVRGSKKEPVKIGDVLNEHDVFETGPDGSLGITFTDNTSFSIGPNSRVAIDTYFFDPKNLKGNLLANLKKGTMMVRSGELTRQQPGSVQVKTPRTVLGVRGTTFVVSVDE
ncbi:MAG TPA: FecR domain-containing protein [Polyangia bacterium]|nr:FecR domain-containing protein [Polyangia bacterium]